MRKHHELRAKDSVLSHCEANLISVSQTHHKGDYGTGKTNQTQDVLRLLFSAFTYTVLHHGWREGFGGERGERERQSRE